MTVAFNPAYVEAMYSISTAHVPLDLLNGLAGRLDQLQIVVYPVEYGALLWVPDSVDMHAFKDACTGEDDKVFLAIIEWALSHNLRWVKLDCDAPEVEGLPVFDHEQKAAA